MAKDGMNVMRLWNEWGKFSSFFFLIASTIFVKSSTIVWVFMSSSPSLAYFSLRLEECLFSFRWAAVRHFTKLLFSPSIQTPHTNSFSNAHHCVCWTFIHFIIIVFTPFFHSFASQHLLIIIVEWAFDMIKQWNSSGKLSDFRFQFSSRSFVCIRWVDMKRPLPYLSCNDDEDVKGMSWIMSYYFSSSWRASSMREDRKRQKSEWQNNQKIFSIFMLIHSTFDTRQRSLFVELNDEKRDMCWKSLIFLISLHAISSFIVCHSKDQILGKEWGFT